LNGTEELVSYIFTVLEEKYNIKIDDVPGKLLRSIVSELRELGPRTDIVERYVTQILVPDLNRKYFDNMRKYGKLFGWGQIERQVHFLLSRQLSQLGYTTYLKPIVYSTPVDLVIEQGGKYLPIILCLGKTHMRIATYKWNKLKNMGVVSYLVEVDRRCWRESKLLNIVDVEDLEDHFDRYSRYRIEMRANQYEQCLYEIWRKYVDRGYLALRNHIEGSTVYDLFLIGFSKIGVKKIRKVAPTQLNMVSRTIRKIVRALKMGSIDKVIILTPFTMFDKIVSEMRKHAPYWLSTEISVRPF